MSLAPIATESHVDEAIRLFLASTMDAVTQGEGQGSREVMEEAGKVEDELRRRLPIGWSTSLATLKRELVEDCFLQPKHLVVELDEEQHSCECEEDEGD